MPQDSFNLKYVAKQLNLTLANGKINKVTQAKTDEIMLHVYINTVKKLLISANASNCRICITSAERENPATAYNFCMLLRKHLIGGVIKSIEQVDFERIIKITILSKNELFEESTKILYVEVMGKYSNIILTENNKILGCIKNADSDITCKRPLITGLNYVLPPAQDKLVPTKQNIKSVLLNANGQITAQFLFNNFSGIAYVTAEKLQQIYEESVKTNGELNIENAINNMYNFIFNSIVTPTLYYQDGVPFDFSCVQYGNGEVYNTSLLEVIDAFYENKENLLQLKNKKTQMTAQVNALIKKCNKKLQIINDKEEECKNYELNKIKGELLISNAYKIKNEQSVELLNYYDNTTIKITLDKNLTAIENANTYFKKYKKQKRTIEAVSMQKDEVLKDKEYYLTLTSQIELADSIEDLNAIYEELIEEGIIKSQKKIKTKVKKITCRVYNIDGFVVKAGRNNIENDYLVQKANKNDIWLHTKNYHSSHILICTEDRVVSDKTLTTCAEICAYYSKGRYGAKIEVDYTKRKNLKKPPKSKLGYFIYTDFKTILANPNKHQELIKSDKI